MLTLIQWGGDLGNHVMDSGKMASETPDSNHIDGHGGCSSGSKEAILQLSNNDDYSGDGTQMEKVTIFQYIIVYVSSVLKCIFD